jgi:hypothetical protein
MVLRGVAEISASQGAQGIEATVDQAFTPDWERIPSTVVRKIRTARAA